MHLNIHPLILIGVGSFLVALTAAFCAWWTKRRLFKVLLILVAVVFVMPAGLAVVAFHPALVDGRFRTYKQFYHDIRIGMTREQVLAAMDRHYPAGGSRQRPKIWHDDAEFFCFFMNPEEYKEPNCEGIFLTLEKGQVTKIAYGED